MQAGQGMAGHLERLQAARGIQTVELFGLEGTRSGTEGTWLEPCTQLTPGEHGRLPSSPCHLLSKVFKMLLQCLQKKKLT